MSFFSMLIIKKLNAHIPNLKLRLNLNVTGPTLDKYVKSCGINPKQFDESAWCITIDQLFQLREHMPLAKRKAKKFVRGDKKLQVIPIQNQKGGVGKTILSTTLASGLATEFYQNYRVGLIDLDGQATASMYYVDEFGDFLSAGDLITNRYKLKEGQTKQQLISSAFQETPIPNLRILAAAQRDRGVDTWIHQSMTKGDLKDPYTLVSDIIANVEDEFDIIIIDTSPSMQFTTVNAYMAATSIIFPIGATENDIDATAGFFQYISSLGDLLQSRGHKGFDFTKLLLTNYRDDPAAVEARAKLDNYYDDLLYSTEFRHSAAIRHCSAMLSTIFDISKSEYPRTKLTFQKAVDNAFAVINRIHTDIDKVWRNQ
ncbi:ParA family protein (plasmid) [Photobacterium leiognathi subsp. mandapamensis]|uniref:ParA family protein n=1 Tax=Photobacterium leiognathi TaxID=553611 RepID=UPI003AF3E3DC